jgi:O-antigen/teichoic acid export membrane protein
LALGRIVTALVGVVTIRLSTSLLTPEQFGVLAILLTFQAFCGLLLVNPVGQYINRHTHTWADDGSLLPRLRSYRSWVAVSALSGALVSGIWSISQPISWFERCAVMLTLAVMVTAATANATSVFLLNMLGRRSLSVGWAGVTAIVGLMLSWALVTAFGTGLAWFAGQALGMAFGALGASYAVRLGLMSQGVGKLPLLEQGALRSYILPLAVATGLMWWLLSGYRLLVEAHWGLAALGQAVVGLTLASQLWGLLESLAMQFLYPLFFRRIANGDTQDDKLAFADLLNTLGPVYLVFLAATAVAAPTLLKLFVDSSYSHVVPFVLLGVAIECCRTLGNLLATAAQVDRRMVALIVPYGAGAVTLTAGLWLLTHIESGIDQAIAMPAVAGVVALLAMAFAMGRLQAFHLDIPRWLGALAVVALSAILVESGLPTPKGFIEAIQGIAIIGLLVIGSLVALLWKNPSVIRLLSVRLHPRSETGIDT